MNNPRLLTGLLVAALAGGGVGVVAQPSTDGRVVTLDEIFESAESNSAQLRPAITATVEADRDIEVARTRRLPDIDVSLSFSFIGDGFTTKRNFSDYQVAPIPHFGNGATLTVTQPVYTGGAITKGIEMAELKSTAARFAEDFERDNLRFRLTGFYLDIYKYSNMRKVVENNLNLARQVLADMHTRYEQGTALQNDITRYELLVSNLELELIRIDNGLKILNNNLVTMSGLPEGTVVLPDTTMLARALPTDGEGWWQTAATANAPSLKMARTGVDISRKAEELVKADKLPKIGLKAAWTMDGPILVEVPPINRNLSYWYVGVGVSYNLGSLYKTNKAQAKSRVATLRATQQYEAAAEQVEMAVRADYIKYMEAYQELVTRTKSIELADRNYAVTSTRYQSDMALITDMLDAANARLDAGQQEVNARINIIYYYYKLLFTTGKI